jgi:putative SOS response-associated peptidase YedK
MAPIHNRMPVIVPPDARERWLDPGTATKPTTAITRPAARRRKYDIPAQISN